MPAIRHGRGYVFIKNALSVFVVLALFTAGCKVDVSDSTPPANPSGVSLTPDANNLIISWVTPNIINLRNLLFKNSKIY